MVKLNVIYTRTGDKGETGLGDGSRRPKSNARVAAMGDVDETNCAIGHVRRARTAPRETPRIALKPQPAIRPGRTNERKGKMELCVEAR